MESPERQYTKYAPLCFVLAVLASPFKSKSRLEAENVALRHQLIVLRRKVQGRARLTNKCGVDNYQAATSHIGSAPRLTEMCPLGVPVFPSRQRAKNAALASGFRLVSRYGGDCG